MATVKKSAKVISDQIEKNARAAVDDIEKAGHAVSDLQNRDTKVKIMLGGFAVVFVVLIALSLFY